MPPSLISHKSFSQKGKLSINDFKRLSVKSVEKSAESLVEGFTGEPVVLHGFKLDDANKHFTGAFVSVQGSLFLNDEKYANAKTFWPELEDQVRGLVS